MSRFFIDRPVFAWVIAIVVMLGGIGGILALPVEQYPDIAPPSVNIRATYPGANADTIQNSVTQIIEQQLTGLDGLLYFSSQSSSRGQVTRQAALDAAEAIGLNPMSIALDAEATHVTETLQRSYEVAKALNVDGTPTFIIGD